MDPLTIAAAVAVAVLGVGRFVRVLIYDAFPPAVWLRSKWDDLTYDREADDYSSWNKLLHCPWCMIPWVFAACIGWFFAGLYGPEWIAWSWWLFWGWLGASYVATMIYVRDEPEHG